MDHSNDLITKGDTAILYWNDGKSIPFLVDDVVRVSQLGVIQFADVIGKPWGQSLTVGNRRFTVLKASLRDQLDAIERGAQIITSKDSPKIIHLASIIPGSKVIEVGAGSGGLSLVICSAVGMTGKVVTYDNVEKNLGLTAKNVKRAGFADRWEGRVGDVRDGIDEDSADAFIMDIPDAASAVSIGMGSLRPGGYMVAYCPIIEQARDVMREMERMSMAEMLLTEIIERDWVVHKGGARPDFARLGHTGFIVSGRRIV